MLPTSCSGRIFGFPKRLAPDGTEVGAIYGIIETTLRLLRQDDVTHVAAATDTVIESFRNDLYEGYKTGGRDRARAVGAVPPCGGGAARAGSRGVAVARIRG